MAAVVPMVKCVTTWRRTNMPRGAHVCMCVRVCTCVRVCVHVCVHIISGLSIHCEFLLTDYMCITYIPADSL